MMLKKLTALEASDAPGTLEAIDAPPSPDTIPPNTTRYLLLETKLVETYLREQAGVVEVQPTLADEIAKRDAKAVLHWIWGETMYDEYAAKGPALVQIQNDSPLYAEFLKEWSACNGGVIINTAAPPEDVLRHLRAILFVDLPDRTLGRFRLQETLALAYVLRSLSSERADLLLGPLQELIWRERIKGVETDEQPESQWWRCQRSKTDYAMLYRFHLTEQEMEALDAALAKRDQAARQTVTEQATEQPSEQPSTQKQENKHHG